MLREVGAKEAIRVFAAENEVLVLDMEYMTIFKMSEMLNEGKYKFLVNGSCKIPEKVKQEPKEEEPFDYGKLGALIHAGKSIEFMQTEFGCTRAQIAARIRIWNKMEEEKNGVEERADLDTSDD